MTKTNPETILLKGSPLRKQADAAGAITPGHLVARTSATEVNVHPTAGGNAQKAFAVENDFAGDGIDHAYQTGEAVQYDVFYPGCEVYALLADNQNATVGSFLQSNGDGTLRVLAAAGAANTLTETIVGTVIQAVDTRGGASAPARIKVEVM